VFVPQKEKKIWCRLLSDDTVTPSTHGGRAKKEVPLIRLSGIPLMRQAGSEVKPL